ncbi:SDR family oxidoreductase [Paucibacter sp. APW11]|uniref:SDR family oxidoreductase n=1 Tax=Roseateles aquae TaxID=3077235 RepID=A0ABU3PEA3_9BURK|nr:SDR family oxidoreductase [Paucibacter sp. APW11]MDT9000597.1 SDR family oxidoreductase [Paucibacter sp. APW11]
MNTASVVLITGAAKRLGRAIALHLAAQGHDIAVHYRHSAAEAETLLAELRALGVRAAGFPADLSSEQDCLALVPAVLAHFGRLDAVVNNASLFDYDDAVSFSFAHMDAHWRANTAAPIVLTRALHQHARQRQAQACVVNLLDQKLWNPNPDYLSYTLSKAALESANTLLAQAFAPWLRVCAVAPGVTLPSGPMNEAEFEAARRLTPLQRSSTPEDLARAVKFLIDSPAITGTTLLVDGGQHLAGQARDVMFLVPPSSEKAP